MKKLSDLSTKNKYIVFSLFLLIFMAIAYFIYDVNHEERYVTTISCRGTITTIYGEYNITERVREICPFIFEKQVYVDPLIVDLNITFKEMIKK